jgi:biotin transporter BioY
MVSRSCSIDGSRSATLVTNPVMAVVAVIVWWLDLQLPMQSVPITTDDVSLDLDQGEMYNIM